MNDNDSNNNPLSFLVTAARWIIDAIARTAVELFDGLKRAIDHSNLSLFALVATALPFVLPLPVAFMTSHSAQKFFAWDPWAANVLGFGLEGLGLLAWVRLVDSVLDTIRTNNSKLANLVYLYGLVALLYEVLLIFVNSVLAYRDGADTDYIIVLTGICLLPALSATIYGAHRQATERALEREKQDAKDLQEKIRQERRADRKEAQQLRARYASETKGTSPRQEPPLLAGRKRANVEYRPPREER